MRPKGKQIMSLLVIGVLLLMFYTLYFDKLMFHKSKSANGAPEVEEFQLKQRLIAEDTLGKVITRNENGWKIDYEICSREKYDFVLAHLRNPPNTPIFVYTAREDQWVSGSIISQGSWEGDHVNTIINYMKKFPNAIFLDLGANVGMFSVTIAALGYRVISIDCLEGNVMRLCASMNAAKLTNKMTIVYNAVSHAHEKVSLGTHKGNVGGTYVKHGEKNGKESINTIFLDDLLDIYTFDQVVMKMDVETFEANVLKSAYKFFDQVKVELLLMEFVAHKNKESGKFIADFLLSHGMEPNVPDHVKNDYKKWGNEVLFVRSKKRPATVASTKKSEGELITTKEQALGKIITFSENKWTSNKDFCPSDTSKFVFTKLASPFNIPIYVYTATEDQWVSGRIINGGIWEEDLVTKILTQMDNHPGATFVDIGSNIGVFSLAVAGRKRNVISVDCLRGNVQRLCNSIKTAGFTDRVSIVYNAVSDERKNFSLGTYEGNVGGTYVKDAITGGDLISSIYLDDLLPLFDLKEVVIKMDVETHEANVLKGAEQFFKSVQVHYFLLEFVSHKGKESGNFIRYFFEKNGMEPELPSTAIYSNTSTWPNEVAFKKKDLPKQPTTKQVQGFETNKNNGLRPNEITTEKETLGKVISRLSATRYWYLANFTCDIQPNFVKANLNRDKNTPIYVYTETEDKWVSGNIIRLGNWEGDLVQKIARIFNEFPEATFLDLGANVGMFSLTIAKLGKRVIAFECLKGNVARLCASMKANPSFRDKMTIVYNAVSNERDTVTLGVHQGNVGGTYVKKIDAKTAKSDLAYSVDSILLDDILEIFKFNDKVIIKMDVETFEANILDGAGKFFRSVEVEALLLEFVAHKGKKSGDFIVNFLKEHSLFPVLTAGMDPVNTNTWAKGEVMFRRKRN